MTCLNSVPIGALLKNKDVQLPHEPNTLFRGAPLNKVFWNTLPLGFWETLSQTLSWSLKTHWVPFELEAGTTQPFLTSCVFGNNLAWNWWKHSFWYQTNLTFTAWCVKCQPQKKKQLNLVRLASVLLGTHENTPLRGPINLTFRTCCVNPKKPLKLVCLALVWLATHANAALGTNKGRCLKILKHANI